MTVMSKTVQQGVQFAGTVFFTVNSYSKHKSKILIQVPTLMTHSFSIFNLI